MREVKCYFAWDDSEFESKEECMEYEAEHLKIMQSIYKKYSFFDENNLEYVKPASSENLQEWFECFQHAANYCKRIKRRANLSIEEEYFISDAFGYCVLNEDFNYELGNFQYNFQTLKWNKVDE